jgi:hypothetical protein
MMAVVVDRPDPAVRHHQLEVVSLDWAAPPLIVELPAILDPLNRVLPLAFDDRDRNTALGADLAATWSIQGS